MRKYQNEGEDVRKIRSFVIDRDRVMKKGRQGFLRELYGMAKEKTSTWEWPAECKETFQQELRECFEETEQGEEQDRKQMMLTIAQRMQAGRQRIAQEYKDRIEREREQAEVALRAPPAMYSSSSAASSAIAAPRLSSSLSPRSIYVGGMGMSPMGGGGGGGGGGVTFSYQRITVISFTQFVSNGANW